MMHDDQPGSSRMSLIGESSSHLGYSTTGGRFSGFTGGAFASTGRFSECATPRSAVTDVFKGRSEGEVVSAGGDAGWWAVGCVRGWRLCTPSGQSAGGAQCGLLCHLGLKINTLCPWQLIGLACL